jgi:uncharacterized membrane protein YkvA (DUF1232 family)
MLDSLRSWAGAMKQDVLALYLAGRDPRVPWYAKALAIATAAYALSPIDLIPDFIPGLGYLDDLLIVPFAIMVTARLIPDPVLEELRAEATRRLSKRPRLGWAGAAVVVTVWLALTTLIAGALLAPVVAKAPA